MHTKVQYFFNFKTIPFEYEYEILDEILGDGLNGCVRKCRRLNTSKAYAVKILPEDQYSCAEIALQWRATQLIKGSIVGVKDVFRCRTKSRFHVVLKLMEGGELLDRLEKKNKFNEFEAAETFWQMCKAVFDLHSIGLVHNDIKLDNFVYKKKNGGPKSLRLLDFGAAIYTDVDPREQTISHCLTRDYAAPEVLDDTRNASTASDVYSLGVCLFVMLAGDFPYDYSHSNTRRNWAELIRKHNINFELMTDAGVSNSARRLAEKMMTADPKERITMKEVFQSHWFSVLATFSDIVSY